MIDYTLCLQVLLPQRLSLRRSHYLPKSLSKTWNCHSFFRERIKNKHVSIPGALWPLHWRSTMAYSWIGSKKHPMHRHCHRTLSLSAMMRLTSLSACSSCLSTSSNEYFALRSLIFTEHMTMRLSNLCKLLSALNHTTTTTTTKYKSHLCSSSLHLIKATLSSKTWASSLRFVSSDLH